MKTRLVVPPDKKCYNQARFTGDPPHGPGLAHFYLARLTMTHTIKIRRVGGSLGAIFPKDLLDELNVGEGDELVVIRNGRDLTVTPADPDMEKVLDAFQDFRKRYRNTLRKLAE
jgi:putative addiction module antidote